MKYLVFPILFLILSHSAFSQNNKVIYPSNIQLSYNPTYFNRSIGPFGIYAGHRYYQFIEFGINLDYLGVREYCWYSGVCADGIIANAIYSGVNAYFYLPRKYKKTPHKFDAYLKSSLNIYTYIPTKFGKENNYSDYLEPIKVNSKFDILIGISYFPMKRFGMHFDIGFRNYPYIYTYNNELIINLQSYLSFSAGIDFRLKIKKNDTDNL